MRLTKYVNIFFTVAKLLLVAVIAISGFVILAQGNTNNLNDAFAGTTTSITSFALAFYAGFWPYGGW